MTSNAPHKVLYTYEKQNKKLPSPLLKCVRTKLQGFRKRETIFKAFGRKETHSTYKVLAIKLTMDLSQDSTWQQRENTEGTSLSN